MARTFSHQRHLQNRKQPKLRACYRTTPTTKHQRGPYAGLADQAHHKYLQAIGKVERPSTDQQQPGE
ncbi:MAG: hypothetical protein LWW87_08560 [Geobacteraceae bacterium]|nr:hypothetical protein [Geobacteraceae bacterium]